MPDFRNINSQKSLNKWSELGVFQADGNELPQATTLGSLIQMNDGKFYIVLDNYFALLRWNRSRGYALAVGKIINAMQETQTASPVSTPN